MFGLDIALGHRTADAQNRLTGVVAEAVLPSLSAGCGQRDRRAATIDLELQRTARIGADDPLHVGEAFDRRASIARTRSPGLRPRPPLRNRLHGIDAGGRCLPAVDRKNRGKDDDGQDEIGDRPGPQRRRAAPPADERSCSDARPRSWRQPRPRPARSRHCHPQKTSHSRRAEWLKASSGCHGGR